MNRRDEMLRETRRQLGFDQPPMPPRLYWLAFGVGLGLGIGDFIGDPGLDPWQAVLASIAIGTMVGLMIALVTYFTWLLVLDPVWEAIKGLYATFNQWRDDRHWAKHTADCEPPDTTETT